MTTSNGGQFQGVQAKVMEAVAAFAQANERVIGELQGAAMATARGFQMPGMPQPETLEDPRRDPLVWYRKGVQALVDSAQRAAKLAETNVQIVTRHMERMQASADHAAREIEQATSGYVSRMRDIYTK